MARQRTEGSNISWKRPSLPDLDKGVAGVFFLALALRALYLVELSGTPGFGFPIIDSATYCEIAGNVQGNGVLDPRLFWQGFFYPIYLSGVFALGGPSMAIARVIQALVGSFTCVLVFAAAKEMFDRRTAITASLITAAYGPLIFFEGELLAAGWAAFLMTAFLYMLLRCDKDWNAAGFLLSGILGGVAVLARPTFLPAVAASISWTLWKLKSASPVAGRRSIRALSITGGFIIVLAAVSILSFSATGHFSPLPRSGSLNLYIGNNEHTERTMMIRPGAEWRNLIREPQLHGYSDDTGYRKYFMDRFRVYAVSSPGSFIKGLLGKTIQLLSSRELPRNVDIYSVREDSLLMRILVWKAGGFGFPFGLLLPLAVTGFIFTMKKGTFHIWSLTLLYSASIVLVFISSRYRVALIPLAAIAAASGLFHIIEKSRSGSPAERLSMIGVIAGVVIVSFLPGPFTVEKYDYTAEKYASIGYEMGKAGMFDEAEIEIRKSIELQPRYAAGHRMLGNILNQAGRSEEAVEHFKTALKEEPGSYMTHFYLSLALVRQGLYDEAGSHLLDAKKGAVAARDEASLMQIERLSALMKREIDHD